MHYVIRNSCPPNTDVATPLATPTAAARNAPDYNRINLDDIWHKNIQKTLE